MDIEAISGATTVALTCTLIFVVIAKSWQLLNRSVASSSSFSDSIMREAAQRFREEFERLNRSQSTYLSAAVVFLVLFISAYILQAKQLFVGYPVWQLYLLLATLCAGAALALTRLSRTVISRHRVKLCRDANIAIGHQLQKLSAKPARECVPGPPRASRVLPRHSSLSDQVTAGVGTFPGWLVLGGCPGVIGPIPQPVSMSGYSLSGELRAGQESDHEMMITYLRLKLFHIPAVTKIHPRWPSLRTSSDQLLPPRLCRYR
jgi:hypothetical protein